MAYKTKNKSGSFTVPDKNTQNRKTNSSTNKKVTSGSGGKSANLIADAYEVLAASIDKFYLEKKCTLKNGKYIFSDIEDPRMFISVKNSNRILEIDESKEFTNNLRRFLFSRFRLPLTKKNGDYIYGMLYGQAQAERNTVVPIQRTLRIGNEIYYNIGNRAGEIIAISKNGIVQKKHPFIKPVYRKDMAENSDYDLSVQPEKLLDFMCQIFNFGRKDILLLTVYLLSLFIGNKDLNIILALAGPSGCGKSTAAIDITQLHDAREGKSPLLTVPDKTSDLALILHHFDCVALDNSGPLSTSNSNLLAQAISSGSYLYRLLYTAKELVSLDVSCAVIITSVLDVVKKDDLISRTLRLTPLKFEGTKREEIGDHREKVAKMRKQVMGCIFNALKEYLAVEGTKKVTIPSFIRLGTFYRFAILMAPILGVTEDEMHQAFVENQLSNYGDNASENFIIQEIVKIVAAAGGELIISARGLYDILEENVSSSPRAKEISANESVLSKCLFDNTNLLRSLGLEIDRISHKGKRAIKFSRTSNYSTLSHPDIIDLFEGSSEKFSDSSLNSESYDEPKEKNSETVNKSSPDEADEFYGNFADSDLDEIDDSELEEVEEYEEDEDSEEYDPYEEDEYFEDEPDNEEESDYPEYPGDEGYCHEDTLGLTDDEFSAIFK